jgi:hypothetical protein
MLGGNQDNAVIVKKYAANVWSGFVFPAGAVPGATLPIYDGVAAIAGSEG